MGAGGNEADEGCNRHRLRKHKGPLAACRAAAEGRGAARAAPTRRASFRAPRTERGNAASIASIAPPRPLSHLSRWAVSRPPRDRKRRAGGRKREAAAGPERRRGWAMWRLGAAWARPAALRGARRGLRSGAAAGSCSAGGLALRSRPGPGGNGGCKCASGAGPGLPRPALPRAAPKRCLGGCGGARVKRHRTDTVRRSLSWL